VKPILALRAGAVLLALIGLSRALAGFVLVRDGASAVSQRVAPDVARLAGLGLVLVGALALAAVIGLFKKRRWGWPAALLALGLFLAAGVVNGFLLYGRPGLLRTGANFLQAIFVAGVLALGRPALQGRARDEPPAEK
jgi:hypothetical protein